MSPAACTPRTAVLAALALLAIILAAAVPAAPAWSHAYKLDAVAIGHLWAPPPEDGADGLPVYGPLLNRGEAPVRLVGTSSPAAEAVRFRRETDAGVAWPETLELSPGRPLGLAAWREHLWVSGLKRPLAAGDTLPLTLDFGDAGRIDVEVMIEDAAGH